MHVYFCWASDTSKTLLSISSFCVTICTYLNAVCQDLPIPRWRCTRVSSQRFQSTIPCPPLAMSYVFTNSLGRCGNRLPLEMRISPPDVVPPHPTSSFDVRWLGLQGAVRCGTASRSGRSASDLSYSGNLASPLQASSTTCRRLKMRMPDDHASHPIWLESTATTEKSGA